MDNSFHAHCQPGNEFYGNDYIDNNGAVTRLAF